MSSSPEAAQSPLPEAGHDPDDPNAPDDHDTPSAPVANPSLDMDDPDNNMSPSDLESDLSDVDEAQFEDFDPANVAIEDRPAIAIDESNVGLIKASKRKRADGEDGGERRKKKEGKREKRKSRKEKDSKSREKVGTDDDSDDNFSGGETLEGKRRRNPKHDGGDRGAERKRTKAPAREKSPVNEDHLSPEERRRRALDRAMDLALSNPHRRKRRKDGEDLEDNADMIIDQMRTRMNAAAQADNNAREAGMAAHQKLKLLPEVMSLLNRHALQNAVLDPEANIMQSVRFFLEPLNDGSLPAYNIQRDLFSALARLPMNQETLVASGLGKVTLFYTKSKRPEPAIRRLAEKLLGDWSRPIMKRSDDYKKRQMTSAVYDPSYVSLHRRLERHTDCFHRQQARQSQAKPVRSLASQRQAALDLPVRNPNRAQMQIGKSSYNIVPKSSFVAPTAGGVVARPAGAIGDDRFRRMKAAAAAAASSRK